MGLRRILLAGVAGALVLGATATGHALAEGEKENTGPDVVQSSHQEQNGNTQEVDVVDLNVCGNTVNVTSSENPAFGNSCTNQ